MHPIRRSQAHTLARAWPGRHSQLRWGKGGGVRRRTTQGSETTPRARSTRLINQLRQRQTRPSTYSGERRVISRAYSARLQFDGRGDNTWSSKPVAAFATVTARAVLHAGRRNAEARAKKTQTHHGRGTQRSTRARRGAGARADANCASFFQCTCRVINSKLILN